MRKTTSLVMHNLWLSIIVLFCGVTSGINITKLAPTISVLLKSFNLSLTQIGLLASIFTLIIDALAVDESPIFNSCEEALVYEFTEELNLKRSVSVNSTIDQF